MKTLIVLFIAILAQMLGNVYLTKGMKEIETGHINWLSLAEIFHLGVEVFTSPFIWLGIAGLLVFFLLYLAALSWSDLSFVLPVTAFGYPVSALLAWAMLGERISLVRALGTLVICAGVVVVSRTEQRTVVATMETNVSEG
jgi:drug/metabolite transporter (DMT)-like permease